MIKIGVLIYDGVAEMDFIGPFEVLSDVNKVKADSTEVYVVAATKNAVHAFNGLTVFPMVDFLSCPELDVLVVPGGKGRIHAMHNLAIRQFIIRQAACARYITSVCTGAFLLAEAGLLKGKRATTFHGAMEELAAYPDILVEKRKVLQDDKVITAAGVTSGLELGFYLLNLLFDDCLAKRVAEFMEYDVAAEITAKQDDLPELQSL